MARHGALRAIARTLHAASTDGDWAALAAAERQLQQQLQLALQRQLKLQSQRQSARPSNQGQPPAIDPRHTLDAAERDSWLALSQAHGAALGRCRQAQERLAQQLRALRTNQQGQLAYSQHDETGTPL